MMGGERRSSGTFREHCRAGARLLVSLWWVAAWMPAQGNPVPPENSEAGGSYEIRSAVNLVLLDVTVENEEGGFVSGLKRDNFQIREDGRPQPVQVFKSQDVPVTIGLVVDNSQSMQPKRFEVTGAAISFIQTCNAVDEFFVVNFNDAASLGLPPGIPFSDDPEHLKEALFRTTPEGKTALYDAMALALEHLEGGRFQKKALVVIADGGDNASRTHTLDQVLAMIGKSHAAIYTVDLYDPRDREHQNPNVLKKFSRISGGRFFRPASLADTGSICRDAAREIREQYTLGYIPTNTARDGGFRRIEVTVSGQGQARMRVRTREGYYAPEAVTPGPPEKPATARADRGSGAQVP